jgi:hypothetical protein
VIHLVSYEFIYLLGLKKIFDVWGNNMTTNFGLTGHVLIVMGCCSAESTGWSGTLLGVASH